MQERQKTPEEKAYMFPLRLLLPNVYHESLRQLSISADRPISTICRMLIVDGIRRRAERAEC
jgi:hypothetical protein